MTAHDHVPAREDRGEHTDDYPREGDYVISECLVEDADLLDDGDVEDVPRWLAEALGGGLFERHDDEDEMLEAIQADAHRLGCSGDLRVWFVRDDGLSWRVDPHHADPSKSPGAKS